MLDPARVAHGAHGCVVIPFERGVCGACARTGQVQLVDDGETFQEHIACSRSMRSEIVLPVWNRDCLIAVSDQPAAFDQADVEGLSSVLASLFETRAAT
jgi:GAF domain-containing protein